MKFGAVLLSVLFLLSFDTVSETEQIKSLIEEDLPYLVDFYKQRHRHPELSLEEKETSAVLAGEMRSLGYEVTENFGGYGIVCILRNGEGPAILYRTDMDGLPVNEKTELEYASQVKTQYSGQETGTMHACGHDMHMTTWLGTARVMAEMRDRWQGTLMMIGQPAEEIGAGAKLMLDAGLYEKFGVPDYGIGLHCSPTIAAGQVGYGKNYTMASAESIDIKVFGIGSHGAAPHTSVDPVVIASMLVMELQTIVSRSIKPTDDVVITVGAINGGIKHNIIPDEVTLKLTVRTFTEEVRELVHRRIREIARGVAIAAGLPEDKLPEIIIPENFTPANFNQPDLVDKLTASAINVLGSEGVVTSEPQMVAEDFSRYGQTEHQVATVLFWLGTVPEERLQAGFLPGLHSPFYYPEPEKTIQTGVSVVTQSLLDLFRS